MGGPIFSPVIDGRKTCSVCRVNKPISDFYERGGGRSGHQAACRPCFIAYRRRDKLADPLLDHRRHVWVKYRLRYDKYEAMLAAQGAGARSVALMIRGWVAGGR